MENTAVVKSKGKIYKSNKVEVYNKCYQKNCKSKVIYYDENCYYRYKIKVIKIIKEGLTRYKVWITIWCKENNKKKKVKFVI